jgi:hypothetical protein
MFAILMGHELLLSALSLAVLALGPLGPLWKGLGHALLIAFLGGVSGICALGAVRAALRRSNRENKA